MLSILRQATEHSSPTRWPLELSGTSCYDSDMQQKARLTPISGDVNVVADIRVNVKGGSMSAILRKPIRESLGEVADHLCAATVDFGDGSGIVLLRADGDAPVFVRSLGAKRFEVTLENEDDEEVDELTAAFLRLKLDQFKKGAVRLSHPYTAESFRALRDEVESLEEEIAAELERVRSSKTRSPRARSR